MTETPVPVRAAGRLAGSADDGPKSARAVTVTGLHKSYGATSVLRNLDLSVPDGSLTAILAPSGSGKTTLLRLIAGFESPDAGTIMIGQTVVSGGGRQLGPSARKIGYVPQEGALFPHLDVAANVGFGLRRGTRRKRVDELLELVGLRLLTDRYPHQLSGGEQQRVALARALAPEPLVLLLDEPFSSLDATLRTRVRRELATILADAGTTTIFVTHDQDEALATADQIVVLRDGTIAQAGAPHEIYTRPADDELARLVGIANILTGIFHGGHVQTALGPLEPLDTTALYDGARVTVLIRPEQLRLDAGKLLPRSTDDISVTGGIAGTVIRHEYHGHDSITLVTISGADESEPLQVRGHHAATLTPGSTVSLCVQGPVMTWPVQSR